MNAFTKFNLNNSIIEALEVNGIETPTPIQEQAIPKLLAGFDVIGQAQTGTGKTFAYSIPILEKLDYAAKTVQALVVCPTRELSLQVSKEISKLAVKTKLRTVTIYGGTSYERQFRELKQNPQIVIGTPGRIIDHLKRGILSFDHVKFLVLDEADEMLKMGFQEDMQFILSQIIQDHQTALFSATMPPFIAKLAKNYLKDPITVKIPAATLTVKEIAQFAYFVKKEDKQALLIRLLDYYQFKSLIIFANTKAYVDELTLFLQENHYNAEGLHGDLTQANRDKVMQSFRLGSTSILIATDVAARGLDISSVDGVINYDLPTEDEIYVHRIGRTGRAGASGIALSIATNRQYKRLAEIEAYSKSKINRLDIPSAKDIKRRTEKKLFDDIALAVLNADDKESLNLVNQLEKITLDKDLLIKGLLHLITKDKTDKNYQPIETVRPKTGNNLKSKYRCIKINVGSKEKVRPNQLINYLHDELAIHREHFGKIVVEQNFTYIEITEQGYRYFTKIKGRKFAGKKLTFHEVAPLKNKSKSKMA